MAEFCYVNGAILPVETGSLSIGDRSFLYGEGLFETMLVQNGEIRLLDRHLARLGRSAQVLGLPVADEVVLRDALAQVIGANAMLSGALRLTLSSAGSVGLLAKGGNAAQITITARSGSPYLPDQYKKGLTAVVAQSTRRNEKSSLCAHKTTNYGDSLLAKREAAERGADEALLLNTSGYLAEGAVTNVFVFTDGALLTPRVADGALPGIMRAELMRYCAEHLVPCHEVSITLNQLLEAEAIMVTNALMGVMPLSRLNDRTLPVDGRTVDILNSFNSREKLA